MLFGSNGFAATPGRSDRWRSVDRRLADAVPAVPLFNRQHLTLVSDRVENVQYHPLWGVMYDQLWVH